MNSSTWTAASKFASNPWVQGAAVGGAAWYGYNKMKDANQEHRAAMAAMAADAAKAGQMPQDLSRGSAPLEKVQRKSISPKRKRSGGTASVEGKGLLTSSTGGKTKLGGY